MSDLQLQIRGYVSTLPIDQQDAFWQYHKELKNKITENPLCMAAFALLGAEIAEQ